jgi:NAD(P)-dependent dehydrogenase (short-subunit alcohol dehydrogenase family)
VILNITGATQHAVPLHAAGSAVNAAIRTFSKVLSLELAPARIRVNSIAPGRIRTARIEEVFRTEALRLGGTPQEAEARTVAQIPVGRLGEADDIARLVCFLASEHAAYINGAAIPVDGGKSPLA